RRGIWSRRPRRRWAAGEGASPTSPRAGARTPGRSPPPWRPSRAAWPRSSGRVGSEPGDAGPARGARLGVDVGTVRVGVAASDPEGLMAFPVTTVARQDPGAAAQVAAIAREREALV